MVSPKNTPQQELEVGDVLALQRGVELLDGAVEKDGLREISFFLSPGEAAFFFVDIDAGASVFTVGLCSF